MIKLYKLLHINKTNKFKKKKQNSNLIKNKYRQKFFMPNLMTKIKLAFFIFLWIYYDKKVPKKY